MYDQLRDMASSVSGQSLGCWALIVYSALGPGALATYLQTKGQVTVPATPAQVYQSLARLGVPGRCQGSPSRESIQGGEVSKDDRKFMIVRVGEESFTKDPGRNSNHNLTSPSPDFFCAADPLNDADLVCVVCNATGSGWGSHGAFVVGRRSSCADSECIGSQGATSVLAFPKFPQFFRTF